jgi:hypothetical protein
MRNQSHELSVDDLAEVSSGLTNFPTRPSLTPSIPIPPPLPESLKPVPAILGGNGPIVGL